MRTLVRSDSLFLWYRPLLTTSSAEEQADASIQYIFPNTLPCLWVQHTPTAGVQASPPYLLPNLRSSSLSGSIVIPLSLILTHLLQVGPLQPPHHLVLPHTWFQEGKPNSNDFCFVLCQGLYSLFQFFQSHPSSSEEHNMLDWHALAYR